MNTERVGITETKVEPRLGLHFCATTCVCRKPSSKHGPHRPASPQNPGSANAEAPTTGHQSNRTQLPVSMGGDSQGLGEYSMTLEVNPLKSGLGERIERTWNFQVLLPNSLPSLFWPQVTQCKITSQRLIRQSKADSQVSQVRACFTEVKTSDLAVPGP